MKYGICAWNIPLDTVKCVQLAAEAGFDGISLEYRGSETAEIWGNETKEKELGKFLNQYNLEIASLAVNALCSCGMSKIRREAQVKKIIQTAVSIATKWNIRILQLPSFGDGQIGSKEELLQTIKMLKYACELACQNHIFVGHESTLIIEEIEEVFHRVKMPNLYYYYDSTNLDYAGVEKPSVFWEYFLKKTIQVHVKDSIKKEDNYSYVPLGAGDTTIQENVFAVAKSGYEGWLLLESTYEEQSDYEKDMKNDLNILKTWIRVQKERNGSCG